jgi:RHS repeat-associated protein
MPYGEPLWAQGTAISRYAFTGEDYDQSVGLLFLRARYMNPTLGVFLARDPWSGDAMRPGSMNGWNYAQDNPVRFTDPSGRISEECRQLGWWEPAASIWCDPYVWWQDRERLRDLMSNVADGFAAIYGDSAAQWQLKHYLYGDGSPSILGSRWYLRETNREAVNEKGRRLADLQVEYLFENALPFMARCDRPIMPTNWKYWFTNDYYDHLYTKLSIGRHIVQSVFYSWNATRGNSCDCWGSFQAYYKIDDPYDFEPIDPVGGGVQELNIGYAGVGRIPFAWMKDLAEHGYAKEFRTKIGWLDEFDLHTVDGKLDVENTNIKILHDY